MITLTKEWLLKTIAELEEERDSVPGAVNEDAAKAHAAMKITLASLETEAVGYIDVEYAELLKSGHIESCSVYAESGEGCCPVYTAPPAPVVDADDNFYSWFGREWYEHYQHNQYTTAAKQMLGVMAESAWKAGRRAAMLQVAEPVTTAYKLPEGWVAVPVEPTEDMIVNGFESEPDESFSDEKEWEEYEAMSGCQQAAHRAKLCWAAMIATAPKV